MFDQFLNKKQYSILILYLLKDIIFIAHCIQFFLQSKGIKSYWISRIIITLYCGNCCNLFRKISSIVATVLIALSFNSIYYNNSGQLWMEEHFDEKVENWQCKNYSFILPIYIQFQLLRILCFGIHFIVPQLFVHDCFFDIELNIKNFFFYSNKEASNDLFLIKFIIDKSHKILNLKSLKRLCYIIFNTFLFKT